jgi:hypothetical protein
MANKVVKVKASKRNGKIVKAHTRVVKGGKGGVNSSRKSSDSTYPNWLYSSSPDSAYSNWSIKDHQNHIAELKAQLNSLDSSKWGSSIMSDSLKSQIGFHTKHLANKKK